MYINYTPKDVARFWKKVDKSAGEDACWIWKGAPTKGRGGSLNWGGKMEHSHRISYLLAFGSSPDKHRVSKTCKNLLCVNPKHLDIDARGAGRPRGHYKGTRSQRIPDREQCIALFGGKCISCGNTNPVVLQIDHVNGGGSKERRFYHSSKKYYQHILDVGGEGYQVLCANCHLIEHHARQMRRKGT